MLDYIRDVRRRFDPISRNSPDQSNDIRDGYVDVAQSAKSRDLNGLYSREVKRFVGARVHPTY
jgi:hypothetical protein